MVERMWLGDWLSRAWEVLFQPEGFGPVPERLKARLRCGSALSAVAQYGTMQPAAAAALLCVACTPTPARLVQVSKSSEFFATRARIQARPRDFYLRCLHFIHEHSLGREQGSAGAWPAHTVGLIFEHTWHHIMGEAMWLDGLTTPECELYRCTPAQQAKASSRQ